MRPQWTVAGRKSSGEIVVLFTRDRTQALRTLYTLADGWAACDGMRSHTIGQLDQALQQSIENAHVCEENRRRAEAQAARRKRR